MLGMLGLVPSGIKMALLAALVAAAGMFYWHYTSVKSERDAALAHVGALKVENQVQDATIDALEENIAEWEAAQERMQATLDALATAQAKATEQQRKLNDVLSKHDLGALSVAKPGLLERRINRGTADVFRMFECASGGCPDDPGGDQ
jgi:uncharacterized coiled-coil protein SlyX